MDFSDFAHYSQQVSSTGANEEKALILQDQMMETLSVMQHHDALTGTHMKHVGADYLLMMA